MKPRTLFFIGTTGGVILGIVIGYLAGYSSGYSSHEGEERNRTYEDLVSALRQRESFRLNDLADVKLAVESQDEGGLFKTKITHYVTGTINNKSVLTPIKDIKLKIDFVSSTNSIISSEEVILYTSVQPYNSKAFKEKISPPEKTSTYQYSVIGLKPE